MITDMTILSLSLLLDSDYYDIFIRILYGINLLLCVLFI